MAFKDLDLNQMVGLFSPYVNDANTKKLFLSIPELAGFHAGVVTAYEAVLSVRPTEVVSDPQIVEISAKQKGVDNRHDHLARALAFFLEGHRERALGEDPPDEEGAAAYDAAYQAILLGSTSITMATYRAEAGNTERVSSLLAKPESAETKAVLKSIPVKKGETALDTAQLWIAAGAELGTLETKKTARAAALQSEPPPPQRVLQGARSQWIKIATILVQAGEVSTAPREAVHAVIFPLVDAAERAGQRGPRKGGTEQPEAPIPPAEAPAASPK